MLEFFIFSQAEGSHQFMAFAPQTSSFAGPYPSLTITHSNRVVPRKQFSKGRQSSKLELIEKSDIPNQGFSIKL